MSLADARHPLDIEAIQKLERQLQRTLSPVQPDPLFIDKLHRRLTTPAAIVLEQRSGRTAIFLIGLGLFLGVFVTWLLRRLQT